MAGDTPGKKMNVCSPSLDSPREEKEAFIKIIDNAMGNEDEVREEGATGVDEGATGATGADEEVEEEEDEEEEVV